MRPSRHLLSFALAATVVCTGIGGSCSREQRVDDPEPTTDPGTESDTDEGQPDLRMLLMTDLDGYLEPCGCTSRPLGGIDRMAARIAELRREPVPSVVLMAGNTLFHGAPEGVETARAAEQALMQAQTVRDVLNRLEVAAIAPGALDFSFTTPRFLELAHGSEAVVVAAGVSEVGSAAEGTAEGDPVFQPLYEAEVGGARVAVIGFTQLSGADGQPPQGLRLEDPLLAGRAAVERVEADLVIALVSGDRRFARRVSRIEGVHFVVHGGLDEPEAHPPAGGEPAFILHAGRQGQGLVVLDLYRGDGAFADASAWTRRSAIEHQRARVETLERRIEAWAADDSTEASDLAAQRTRLSNLREELRALEHPAAARGAHFRARYIELPPDSPQDPEVTALMGALARRINERNRVAFADWAPEPAPAGAASYVGSDRCGTCHASAATWWRQHPHGRAYATLETRDKNYNLSCVGCHVTGYLRPGGSTVTQVERLENVGCESCHGPGSMHVTNPSGADVNVVRTPEERTCLGCHTPEHSDTFEFTPYRDRLLVPGHGRPATP